MARPHALLVTLVTACAPASVPAEDVWRMPVSGAAVPRQVPSDLDPGELPESLVPREDDFWRAREETAWQEAEASGRGLLVDFDASWCAECRAAATMWNDPELRRQLVARFVPLRLDVTEITPETREQLERYRVRRLPTIVLVASDRREVRRFEELPAPEVLLDALRAIAIPPR